MTGTALAAGGGGGCGSGGGSLPGCPSDFTGGFGGGGGGFNGAGSGGGSGGGSSPSLIDYLNFGGKTATGVLGALNQPKGMAAPKTNFALIGGIVAALVGVLLLVMVVSKK